MIAGTEGETVEKKHAKKRRESGYWHDEKNRVEAVRKLVKMLDEPVDKVRKKDFLEHNLSSLLNVYRGSVSRALLEAGFDRKKVKKESGYWDEKENRIKEIKQFVEELGKDPDEITKKDFRDHHLSMLFKYGSLQTLLEEAGYARQKNQMPRGYWNSREHRVKAIRQFVRDMDKPFNEITKKDFIEYGLSSLLNKYNGSLWRAIEDAGFKDIKVWRAPGYWNKKENRVNAVRELVEKLGRDPGDVTRRDFVENNLGSLLNKYKDEACKDFERGDIFTFDKGYLLEYKTETERALAESELLE